MNECIVWRGFTNACGYGWKTIKGKQHLLHRFVWEFVNGPIPDGMQVLHHCDNPPCVNPDHLWLGTHADNMRDKSEKGRHFNQIKAHCKRGHPLSGENLYKHPRGQRICKICRRASQAKSRGNK